MAIVSKTPQLIAVLGAKAAEHWAQDNGAWLKSLIDKHNAWIKDAEVEKYQLAYDGYFQSIEDRKRAKGNGTENKLTPNLAQIVIDTPVDYLLGKAPSWTVEDTDQEDKDTTESPIVTEYRKEILKLLRSKDADARRVLSEQLRQGSIAGHSCIISWVDEKGKIDYEEFPVNECIPVFDAKGRLALVIRVYSDEVPVEGGGTITKTRLEVYDEKYITYYIGDNTGENFELDPDEEITGNPIAHMAGRIPVSVYINCTPASYSKRVHKAGTSDLANGVYSLLEAYAHGVSDKANLMEYLQDQYLKLKGVDVDQNEVIKMQKARAIALKSSDSDASFIAQDQEDKAVENGLDRQEKLIYDTTYTPKISDLSGATATEVKMKYVGLDIKAGKKETYFTSAINSFVIVLTDFLNAKRLILAGYKADEVYEILNGKQPSGSVELYSADWLQFTLNRNIPQNFKEIADIVAELAGKVPDSYLYELLWFVEDPVAALEEMKTQKAETAKQNMAAMGYTEETFNGGNGTSTNTATEDEA